MLDAVEQAEKDLKERNAFIEIVNARFRELKSRRDALAERLAVFYGGDEYAKTDATEIPTLESRRNIPAVKNELWEISKRLEVVGGAPVVEGRDDANAIPGYFEQLDGDAMAELEKGLPTNATRAEILSFVANGYTCDECRAILADISAVHSKLDDEFSND